MINYIRNYLILIFFQSALIQFCLNQTIIVRFNMEPFRYYEIFMLCLAYFTLTHNYRLTLLLQTNNTLRELLASCGIAFIHSSSLILKDMEEIKNKIGTEIKDDNKND